MFSREDPYGWLFWMEQFFSINRFSEKEKIITTGIALEADALSWFQWQNRRRPLINWAGFNVVPLQRFRSSQEGNLCEQFFALRQVGSVADYRWKFEVSAAPLQDVLKEILKEFLLTA